MKTAVFNGFRVNLIQTPQELEQIKSNLTPNITVGMDTEGTGLCYINDRSVGLCISTGKSYSKEDYEGYYIPYGHSGYPHNIDKQLVMELAQHIIDNYKTCGFNRNYDLFMLEKEGIVVPFVGGMQDAQVMCHLATNESFPSLKKFAYNYLKWQVIEYSANTVDEDYNFGNTDPLASFVYAAGDAVMTVMLAKKMYNDYPYIRKIYPLDNRALEAVRRLSKTSLLLNGEIIQRELEMEQKRLRETKEKIFNISGYIFNPDSNVDKADALSRYVTLTSKTKTGKFQVNEAALKLVIEQNPDTKGAALAELFIRYAGIKKYISSYLDKMKDYVDNDFRVNYSSVNVNTGRLSSGGGGKREKYYRSFNIQNVPKVEMKRYLHDDPVFGYRASDEAEGAVCSTKIKGGLRDAFTAPEGYSWMTYDYAQEELKVAACLSNEMTLINAVREGKDLHTAVAEKMFGFSSPDNRTQTKTLNFAVLYGATEYTISQRLKCSIEYAKGLMQRYFKTMRNLDAWIKDNQQTGRRQGMVFTYYGRPRLLYKYYNSSEPGMAAFANRTATNTICQGDMVPESRVLTDKGWISIQDLIPDMPTTDSLTTHPHRKVWTGESFETFGIFKHDKNPTTRVSTSNGMECVVGSHHIFKVLRNNQIEDCTIQDLRVGDLCLYTLDNCKWNSTPDEEWFKLGLNWREELKYKSVLAASDSEVVSFLKGSLEIQSKLVWEDVTPEEGRTLQLLLNRVGVDSVLVESTLTVDPSACEGYNTTTVVSIESVGESETYCLSLHDQLHQYVAEGLVHHNCLPLNSYIELEDRVTTLSQNLGKRQTMLNGGQVVPSRRGDNEYLRIDFKGGNFALCDLNHKFIAIKDGDYVEVPLRDGIDRKKILLSPLPPKSTKISWKYLLTPTNICWVTLLNKVSVNTTILKGDKIINTALWKLAVTGSKFAINNQMNVINLRSLASLYGFNMIYHPRKAKYSIKLTRSKTDKFRAFRVVGEGAVGSCTVLNGRQMYTAQGFWNKNTGGDVIRIVLCALEKERMENPEFAENVVVANTVHDEVNFWVKNEYRYKADKIIRRIMTIHPKNFKIPLTVDAGMGPDWGHCVDFTELNPDGSIAKLKE